MTRETVALLHSGTPPMKIAMLYGPGDLRLEEQDLDTRNLAPQDVWVQTRVVAPRDAAITPDRHRIAITLFGTFLSLMLLHGGHATASSYS